MKLVNNKSGKRSMNQTNMDWQHLRSKRSSISAGMPYVTNNLPPTNMNNYNYNGNGPNAINSLQNNPIRPSYYESYTPLYYSDWSRSHKNGLIALSSYREDLLNKLTVLSVDALQDEDEVVYNFDKLTEANLNYPVTKLQWDPSMSDNANNVERLATTSECLRVYELESDDSSNISLVSRLTLTNSKTNNYNTLPPLTSFDWNKVDPGIIITSSIDTTCTVWDIRNGGTAKTQLIAHDSEVFDVKFTTNSLNIFASVGNDGSMRVFDLRSLDHSTIIYEPITNLSINNTNNTGISSHTPLLKLATSNVNNHMIATFGHDSSSIIVLDMRYPGIPVVILNGHSANINSIEWHPPSNYLLSGSDDCQALIWDLDNLETNKTAFQATANSPNSIYSVDTPSFAYNESTEINNVTWNEAGDHFGVVGGKGFQIVSCL